MSRIGSAPPPRCAIALPKEQSTSWVERMVCHILKAHSEAGPRGKPRRRVHEGGTDPLPPIPNTHVVEIDGGVIRIDARAPKETIRAVKGHHERNTGIGRA